MADVIDVAEQGVGPTPETLAKLRPDPFRVLYILGGQGPQSRYEGLSRDPQMNSLMFDAGIEIRRAFELITAPVALKIHDYQREVRRTAWEAADSHADSLLKNERVQRRYNNWVDRMSQRHLPVGPILDVVVDGIGCQTIDRGRRKGTGYTGKILREGLRIYCEIAGWVRRAA